MRSTLAAEWVNTLCYINKIECYTDIKMNQLQPNTKTWWVSQTKYWGKDAKHKRPYTSWYYL